MLRLNDTFAKALITMVPVFVPLVYGLSTFKPQRPVWSLMLFVGALCFGVVVLTHLAEALHVPPMMGWGEPDSLGHYIDLSSALGGVVLLVSSVVPRIALRPTRKAAV